MAKKAKLTIVQNPVRTNHPPPRKLGEHGLRLWNAVMNEYNIDDIGGLALLAQACAATQRAEDLAAIIEEQGAVIHTRNGAIKSHPCLKDELAARSFVVRTLSRLGITTENVKAVGRPLTQFGWSGDHT